MKLEDYFLSLKNNIKINNFNYHLKCVIHPGNDIICYNYEIQEYYCIECYRLNEDKEYDIRFFNNVNLPNDINRNEIEFIHINSNNDNFIKYLKKKNEHYFNIINKYYNLIYLNHIFINSYENKFYNNINILNINNYSNILKYYDLKEEEYLNKFNSKELEQINNIKDFNKKFDFNLNIEDNYINLAKKK